jgi:hypothetical protein
MKCPARAWKFEFFPQIGGEDSKSLPSVKTDPRAALGLV